MIHYCFFPISFSPIFFHQKRFGFNNESIDVLKFRSLHHHWADPLASKVVTKNDFRATRVGRFIRKTIASTEGGLSSLPGGKSDMRSRTLASLQFGMGGSLLINVLRAVRRCKPEQTRGLLAFVLPKPKLADVEIGLADLVPFCFGVDVVGGSQHVLGTKLAEIEAHHRRGPFDHVDLRRRFRQPARQIAALVYYIEPDRRIGIGRIKLARSV